MNLSINAGTLPSFYGQVSAHSYSFAGTNPNPTTLPDPVTFMPTYVPPTSQMDYQNVVPDSNLDGIVQADHDQNSFGNDTGSIQFAMLQQMPQVFIPLNTDGMDAATASAIPVHAYLQQGAFGSSDTSIGSPGNDYLTYADADQNGLSLAYSLDTRACTNLLLTSGDNHIERVEIVRPGGNSVVFDFAWNSTSGEFGQVGIPVGYNERDSRMLYTLVDLTPGVDTDLAYRMQFTSGITQTFDAATGKLASVGDTNSGLSASAGGSLAIGVDGNPSDPATPRYNIDLKFANGKLSEADYRTTADSPDKIATALTYNSAGSITHLDKTDDAGLSVPDYALDIAGDTINAGRYDSPLPGRRHGSRDRNRRRGQRKLDRRGYGVQQQRADHQRRGISERKRLLHDAGRHGLHVSERHRPLRQRSTHLDHSPPTSATPTARWEHCVYDDDSGWLIDDYTPYKNTASTAQVEPRRISITVMMRASREMAISPIRSC